MKDLKLEIMYMPTEQLTPYKNNAKLHPQEQIDEINASITKFGMNDPIAVCGIENIIVEGHGRLIACQQLGIETVPVIRLDHLTEDERKLYTLLHNKLTMDTGFDLEMLKIEMQEIALDLSDFNFESFDSNIFEETENEPNVGSLAELFLFSPFSVLDGRSGRWQDRKKAWTNLGLKSELGRDENLMDAGEISSGYKTSLTHMAPATSVFDPVICELVYKWFNVDNGLILDPFAGGSVRGIVAAKLGFPYKGIELREEQVNANYDNARELNVADNIEWINADSLTMNEHIEDASADLVFSCPPYGDLEIYSDDPADLSNMSYEDFIKAYRQIIKLACNKLKENSFAVFVVGDFRDKKGFYRDFISDTKKAFIDSGALLYNELIKLDPLGSAGLRAKRQFSNRKCVKVHQNILVFYKGDPNMIQQRYKEVEVDYEI